VAGALIMCVLAQGEVLRPQMKRRGFTPGRGFQKKGLAMAEQGVPKGETGERIAGALGGAMSRGCDSQ